mgnify:CR=1 FL=1
MNLPTLIIALIVAALLGLAIRYLVRHGACAACEMGGTCSAKKTKETPAGCGGKCAGCQYYAYEQRLAAAAKAKGAAFPPKSGHPAHI